MAGTRFFSRVARKACATSMLSPSWARDMRYSKRSCRGGRAGEGCGRTGWRSDEKRPRRGFREKCKEGLGRHLRRDAVALDVQALVQRGLIRVVQLRPELGQRLAEGLAAKLRAPVLGQVAEHLAEAGAVGGGEEGLGGVREVVLQRAGDTAGVAT